MYLPFPQSPVTPEAAALLARIENRCTVECCTPEFYSPWNRAAVDGAADLWALRHGWPGELVAATFKRPGCQREVKQPVSWNATTCTLENCVHE